MLQFCIFASKSCDELIRNTIFYFVLMMYSVEDVLQPDGQIHIMLHIGSNGGKQYDRWNLDHLSSWKTVFKMELSFAHICLFSGIQKLFPKYQPRDEQGASWTPTGLGYYVFQNKNNHNN